MEPKTQKPRNQEKDQSVALDQTTMPPLVGELIAYLADRADPEVARRVEAGLADPGSEVRQLLDDLRNRDRRAQPSGTDGRPVDIEHRSR